MACQGLMARRLVPGGMFAGRRWERRLPQTSASLSFSLIPQSLSLQGEAGRNGAPGEKGPNGLPVSAQAR